MAVTIGQYLLDRLKALGVNHIFGIPGDYVIRFDKLIEQHSIEFINATRENTAGYLADAYARLRGLGVACITYGVGINIANATAQAYVESSPLVIISGAAGARETANSHVLHHHINKPASSGYDTTQMEIFKKMTVDQARLSDPSTAATDIERVLQSCLFYKKPVYLELPRDLVDKPLLVQAVTPMFEKSDPATLKEALEETARILSGSQRPIIWAGHDLRIRRLAPALLQFAERYRIPIASTLLGKGVISERHPLYVGLYQGDMSLPAVKELANRCDAALILGVIFTDVDTGNFTTHVGNSQQIIAYPTSVTIGHHSYEHVLLQDFVSGLASLDLKLKLPVDFSRYSDRETASFKPKRGAKTTTLRLFECLQSHLRPEHIIVSDIGDCLFGASDLVVEQDAFLAGSLFASLGFGVPGAIGASIAKPDKRVIAVVGDGAFQMTATELATAVYYKLDPVIILLNNHGYGMERPLLEGRYNDILNWNYAELPRVFGGGRGVRVTDEEGLERALSEALAQRGQFSLIEVELDKTDFSPAMHRFGALFSKTI